MDNTIVHAQPTVWGRALVDVEVVVILLFSSTSDTLLFYLLYGVAKVFITSSTR
jgi:hypothetical protein